MNVLRIEKRDDGWWIANVPSSQADSAGDLGYGPYLTRKQAVEDKRGLEQFFREQGQDGPVLETSLSPAMTPAADAPDEEPATALACEPSRGGRKRHIKSAPGQKLLPGFEPE